jgi:hypothetical protein
MMSGGNAGRTAAQVQQDSHLKDGQKEEQIFAKEKTPDKVPDKVLLFSRCYCDNLFCYCDKLTFLGTNYD